MSTRLFGPRCGGFATARHAMMAVCIGAAIVSQVDSVSAQSGTPQLPPVVLQPPMNTATKPWTGKRLPDGQPDLGAGVWDIPLGGTGRLDNPWNASCFDSPTCFPYKNPRPSRVVYPADGRVPYQPWALARQMKQEVDYLNPTAEEHIDPQARCLPSSVPRLNYYIAEYKILQIPDYVVFVWDSYHAYRVIPLNGGPRLASNVKTWMGDARGRWDGNTLIVETTNINGKMRLNSRGDFYSDQAHLMERFVFTDADNMVYEVTITDPTVYTRPWTMRVLHKRLPKTGADAEFWEEACVEGNDVRPGGIDSRIK